MTVLPLTARLAPPLLLLYGALTLTPRALFLFYGRLPPGPRGSTDSTWCLTQDDLDPSLFSSTESRLAPRGFRSLSPTVSSPCNSCSDAHPFSPHHSWTSVARLPLVRGPWPRSQRRGSAPVSPTYSLLYGCPAYPRRVGYTNSHRDSACFPCTVCSARQGESNAGDADRGAAPSLRDAVGTLYSRDTLQSTYCLRKLLHMPFIVSDVHAFLPGDPASKPRPQSPVNPFPSCAASLSASRIPTSYVAVPHTSRATFRPRFSTRPCPLYDSRGSFRFSSRFPLLLPLHTLRCNRRLRLSCPSMISACRHFPSSFFPFRSLARPLCRRGALRAAILSRGVPILL